MNTIRRSFIARMGLVVLTIVKETYQVPRDIFESYQTQEP